MTIQLHDPIGQIEQECAKDQASWRRANEALVLRFGATDAEWVKRRAWKYVNGEIEPGTRKDTK